MTSSSQYGSVELSTLLEHQSIDLQKPKKCVPPCNSIVWSAVILLLVSLTVLLYKYYDFNASHLNENDIYHRFVESPQIRGGEDAEGTDYPWIASWRSSSGGHCCTGSLINQDPAIILTAAHCTACGTSYGIDVGRTSTSGTDSDDTSFSIDEVITHPSYGSPTSLANDIAMVVLDGSTTRDVIPLVNPKLNTRDVFPEETPMDILGYGYLNQADTIPSTQLQIAEIQYWSKSDCYEQLDEECSYGSKWDEESMLCGWNEDQSTEKGDSGGPALMNGLLSGVNSWSPGSCDDDRILDIFADVGSARHWIENNKPTTETYVVGIHICDETWAGSGGSFYVYLHGSMDDSSILALSTNTDLDDILNKDGFNVFRFEIDNIGWTIDSITFKTWQSDGLCIDSVVAGRLDGPQLFAGSNTQFWVDNPCDGSVSPCYTTYEVTLYDSCNQDPATPSFEQVAKPQLVPLKTSDSHTLTSYDYEVIVHICDHVWASSTDNFYVRLHGTYDTTEWIQLQNDAMSSDSLVYNDVYIYHIQTDAYIGIEISVIDFQAVGSDGTCIDMVSVGRSSWPRYWKGSNELFWLDNPCAAVTNAVVSPCYEFYSLPLYCYDF
eukprot:66377_1